MKKHRIILCAIMCLCSIVTSCEDKKNTPENPSVPEVEVMGYRPAEVELSQDFEEIISLDTHVGDIYIFGRLKTGGYAGYITDSTFREYERMNFVPQTDEAVKSSALLPFGKKAILTYLDGKTMIYVYGADGIQEDVLDCGEVLGSSEQEADIIPYGRNGYIVKSGNNRLTYILDTGEVTGDIKISGNITDISRGTENTVNCIYTDGGVSYIAEIDAENLSVTGEKKIDVSESFASCAGKEYSYIGVSENGIYGFKNGRTEKITDFTNMDFKPSDVRNIIETDSGYAVSLNNGSMAFITEDDISELKSKKLIQIGMFRSSVGSVRDVIDAYNEKNSGGEYKAELKIYPNTWTDGEDIFRTDILSGSAPDIIPTSYMQIDSFNRNYDCFADLYPLIDNDPELSREDFLPNILEGLERDGKLLQLGNQFRIEGIFVDEKSGIPENWTVDDMIKAYERTSENDKFFNTQDIKVRNTLFKVMLDCTMYVDYNKKECYFDSLEFVKFLKFFQENEIGLTMEQFNNGETPSTEKYDNIVVESNTCIPNMESMYDVARSDRNVWAGYVGNGTKSGTSIIVDNLYAINAYSQNIDGAWDFFRTFYIKDYEDVVRSYYFPVKMKTFNEQLNALTRDLAYVDFETGKTVIEKRRDGMGRELENFTQEECEYYKNKILSLRVSETDNSIDEIIYIETDKYFSGEGTAEQTAENIQKKVSAYLKGE